MKNAFGSHGLRHGAVVAALVSSAALASVGVMSAAGTASAADPPHCYITASAANIRSKPSASSTILGVGYRNQTCTDLKQSASSGGHDWYRIKMTKSHVTGWVRDDLVYVWSQRTCIPEIDPVCAP